MATVTKPPTEKKKLVAAVVLGVIAVAVLGYVVVGSFSGPTKPVRSQTSSRSSNTPSAPTQSSRPDLNRSAVADQIDPARLTPIDDSFRAPVVDAAGRNIFAYYVPPPPTPRRVIEIPTPTPPPPPVVLRGLSPSNVYARQSDFTLEVSGDKFTSETKIFFADRELATRFLSEQKLAATVPANLIATEGPRQITVKTPNGVLFSNVATLNVAVSPAPNYIFVGYIGRPRYNDIAVLKEKTSQDITSFQRGDIVGGRFRVSSISENEVLLIDTNLKIKHTIGFTGGTGNSAGARPSLGSPRIQPPKPATDDDDPQE